MDKEQQAAWARALSDDKAFQHEQSRLGHVWTLLGVIHDLKSDGDWIRATLGGRSILVQRFGDVLKGFENRCAHRFYPLRNSDKGHSPLVCGFHHWRYNQDGEAVGIPVCPELFGVTPRELGAKLSPVEIATCGSFVFGRFPSETGTQSLAEFLAEGFPIVDALCTIAGPLHLVKHEVEANWKLMMQITLDDYHIVAVHHRPGYHRNSDLHYYRFGPHSAHFVGEADTLASMAKLCRDNRFRPSAYRIFNIFPNMTISLFRAVPYWYSFVQQFVPVAPGRSVLRGWYFVTRFSTDEESSFDRLMREFSEPVRARIIRYYIDRTAHEDHLACEQLQSMARQIDDRWPILSSQEKRIEWFEEAYAQAVRPDVQSPA